MNVQPSSLNCFVCGVENDNGLHLRFYESDSEPVQVIAEYTVPKQFQGYPGVVHGGIIAAMLDEVASRTVMRGVPPRVVVTARLSIRYRKPVPVETPLRLVGRVVEDKGKVATVAGQLTDVNGLVLAEAEAVVVEVDQGFLEAMSPDEANGWRVYDTTHGNPLSGNPGGGAA